MKARAGSAEARAGRHLIIWPWSHDPSGFLGHFHDRDFGALAGLDAASPTEPHLAFFDR
ncbi:hypothetical protein AB0G54_27110 [Streptomyces yokosukanensis]|uniref:hypothetical protein n=1 Tax=Streptomyces yokosukanensis TaxID=67386 RepID=UPI00341A524A